MKQERKSLCPVDRHSFCRIITSHTKKITKNKRIDHLVFIKYLLIRCPIKKVSE